MAPRTELNEKLVELLGSRNVYFQGPSNRKMKYPAIVYDYSKFPVVRADNDAYLIRTAYDLTLIDTDADSSFIDPLLHLPYCSFDRHYISDNLHHFTFTLFY